MGREREASRAPPVRVVRGGLSLTAAARGPGPLSPAGLQSRFGNQGAQLVLGAVASRTAEPARPAPVAPTAAPVANDPGKPASAQPPPVAAAATPAGTAPAGPAPAAGAAPAAGPAPANDGGPAVAAAPPKAGAEAAPAAEAPAPSPADAVAPVAAQVRKRAGKARVHADADSAKNVAQAAGKNPATERSRAGALATVAAIDAIKPPVDSFRVKLIAALKEALPKEPKNADEAKRAQGQAKDSNQQISAALGTASEETTGTLEAASQPGSDVKAEGPDTPEVKLVPEVPGSSPAPVAAGPAVPESVPPPDLSGDRAETDRAMADAGVSKDQLAKSNEPEFNAVLQAREGAERAEAQRAEQFKAGEGGILAKQQGQTGAMLGQGLGSIHGARSDGLGLVGGKQTETQSKEAAERTRVTGLIEGIKNKTREAVLEILKLMETAATTAFAAGLGLAEKAYEDAFEENKGGIGNWLTNWGDDWEKLIEQSFKKGRSAYDRIVTETVNSVADIVETRLALAKARVQQGRKEVDDFVAGLTGESAKYGEEARTQIASEFEAMDGEIDSKRDEMVTALVDQYRESQKRVSALEEKLREANKSLWQRIKDATIGIIKKIIAFKNFLLDVLARMAQVVSAIIDDPIGFLGNLIDGIMAGMEGFRSRIGQHLKKGLMEWLFGALEGAGIKIPETFDLKGIVGLVLQILGLTWDNIKARAIKVLGADTVAYLEKSWEIFQVLIKEGPGGLWRMLVEKIGDIKEMLLTQLGDFVKEKIIEAGIKWVLSLLNPVAAFIKACMAIYDIVKFFIDRAAQIASLINAILDTLGAIVKGNIAAMATSVENALARMIPVAIGFLASLLGLGGISDKIKAVIDKLRAPVNAAIDWIIGKAAGLVKKGAAALFGGKEKKGEKGKAKAGGDHEVGEAIAIESPQGGHKLWIGPGGEVVMASKQQPLTAHLAEFAEHAKEIEDDQARKKVATAISEAKKLAKSIEKDAQGLKKVEFDSEEWQEIDDRIEKSEAGLRPHLLAILSELEANVPKKTDLITLQFAVDTKLDKAEYARQLSDQNAGLNALSVELFIRRRDNYTDRKEFRKSQGKKNKSGRDPRAQDSQNAERVVVEFNLSERMRLSKNTDDPIAMQIDTNPYYKGLVEKMFNNATAAERKSGMSKSRAEAAVEGVTRKRKTAALHGPDQVAGGRHDDLLGLGDYDVNSDIGRNWGKFGKPKHLATELQEEVEEFMKKKKVLRAFWRAVAMNVLCKMV